MNRLRITISCTNLNWTLLSHHPTLYLHRNSFIFPISQVFVIAMLLFNAQLLSLISVLQFIALVQHYKQSLKRSSLKQQNTSVKTTSYASEFQFIVKFPPTSQWLLLQRPLTLYQIILASTCSLSTQTKKKILHWDVNLKKYRSSYFWFAVSEILAILD